MILLDEMAFYAKDEGFASPGSIVAEEHATLYPKKTLQEAVNWFPN